MAARAGRAVQSGRWQLGGGASGTALVRRHPAGRGSSGRNRRAGGGIGIPSTSRRGNSGGPESKGARFPSGQQR